MPNEIRVTLNIEIDGVAAANMPVIRRYITNETTGLSTILATPDNDTTTFHAIASGTMPVQSITFLQTDQNLNINLNQLSAFALNGGGFLLIVGGQLTQASPTTNVEYNNPSATITANISTLLAGT